MTAKIHYAAQYVAEGGPGAELPHTAYPLLGDLCTGAIGIAFDHSDGLWKATDADGQVFAEAANPAELAPWMAELLASMGRMHERGEL